MTYACLVIDDEELARELIVTHLAQLPDFEVVATCASALEARKVLQQHTIDLLFLDIEMPLMKGTEFFKNLLHQPKVIFTTAYRDYALDGFELNAVDYLLKPITFERLFKATEKFLSQQPEVPPTTALPGEVVRKDHIFIRKDRKQVKLLLDSILYVESRKDYITIHCVDEKHTVKYSISAFQKLLDDRFLRIHRSYIVNVNQITAYTKQDVEISRQELPIGEQYRESVRQHFQG
ncbi:LytR/AlgR family response regulator transcription factor [Tunicatimonas pelagia]|uniref:LytR/AlgR family response regulator transcription factor n=1 Tax=Tunicatimonas pelagia TaxID=931531 RepID=UPI002666C6F4|nr:LytTR family DNA-binding domain-containing protein [Tunicatimonas pelagia]WKN45644.1 LytTR family DNA-binding domain-containing protein [Tunicatimonas pelagia]